MQKFLSVALVLFFLSSCEDPIEGNGEVKRETRESAPFQSIDVEGDYEVYIEPGNYTSITVEADENLLPHIETYVKNNTLKVSSKKQFGRYRELALYITMQEVKKLEATGDCQIETQGRLTGKNVELEFSGSTEAFLDLNAEKLEGDFSGTTQIELTGNAGSADIESSGSVNLVAADFKTGKCRLRMSGSSKATVHASNELDVKVSGSSSVRYRGNPGSVKQDLSGTASVKPMEKTN